MQEAQSAPGDAIPPRKALGQCRQCVAGMLERLEELAASLLAGPQGSAAQLSVRAGALVAELDEALNLHIADEEKDVFPAVLASADSPARRSQAFELVSSLLVEHREIAELWHALRIALLAVGGGVSLALPGGTAADFLVRVRAHLDREESELADLIGMIDSGQSQRIAVRLARRHDEVCPRIESCPRKA